MKLLLFSDLHGDVAATERIAAVASRFDVLVGAGDFCNARRGLPRCLDVLQAVPVPLVLVAGNNETTEQLQEACADWPRTHVLHGAGVTVGDIAFFGLGGGVPVTPFGPWSYDFTEEQADELLADCPGGCVLVSHSPPKGTLDVSSRGTSLGSAAVRRTIERVTPRLVVCGHIHASGGRAEHIGPTPVVNAGPSGVEWELDMAR